MADLSTRDAAYIRNWLLRWLQTICEEPGQTVNGVAISGFVFGVNAAMAHPELAETMVNSIYLLDLPTANPDQPLQAIWRAEQALAEINEALHDTTS